MNLLSRCVLVGAFGVLAVSAHSQAFLPPGGSVVPPQVAFTGATQIAIRTDTVTGVGPLGFETFTGR